MVLLTSPQFGLVVVVGAASQLRWASTPRSTWRVVSRQERCGHWQCSNLPTLRPLWALAWDQQWRWGGKGSSWGDIVSSRRSLFHTCLLGILYHDSPFALCHPHPCLSSFEHEKHCLHPSLEGRGNVVVVGSDVLAYLRGGKDKDLL
jgi:hypothetical protein